MPEQTPAFRSFFLTLMFGFAIVASLWVCVRIAARVARPASLENSTATSPIQREAMNSVQINAQDAAGRAAGDIVLLFGVFGVLAAAVFIGVLSFRRTQELDVLAERVQWMADLEQNGPITFPPDRSAAMDPIYRLVADSHDRIRAHVRRLDSERRRGFHVLGHMTDGVVAVSSDRRVVLLNPAARHLLGMVRQRLMGRRLAEVIRVPQIVAAVDAVLEGRGPEEVEFDFPSDAERSLRVQAIELPSDGTVGVLVTIRDETQVRHLERMRREFIANVSHELKTPLAAVKGYAETLQLGAKEDPETCTHFLNQIDFQAGRLERLINDMLQLARAQTGVENLRIANVPLVPVVRESVTTYEPLANSRNITVNWTPPKEPVSVIADREALLTIVNNLVGNAVRYTPEGGRVDVSVQAAGHFWAITVKDNGIGIPEEDQQRIFERFYRVEKARDATRGGTGLGLSIVKNLVQALGGEIRMKSKLGEGSTFKVLLRGAMLQDANEMLQGTD
jgi:two-component system, OmpR family, phosphate regulon sensor histidine kinase PhoR